MTESAPLGYLTNPCTICGARMPRLTAGSRRRYCPGECTRAAAAQRKRRQRLRDAGDYTDPATGLDSPGVGWPLGEAPWLIAGDAPEALDVLFGGDGIAKAVPDDWWRHHATPLIHDDAYQYVLGVDPDAAADFGPDTRHHGDSKFDAEVKRAAYLAADYHRGLPTWPVCRSCDWPHPHGGPCVLAA